MFFSNLIDNTKRIDESLIGKDYNQRINYVEFQDNRIRLFGFVHELAMPKHRIK